MLWFLGPTVQLPAHCMKCITHLACSLLPQNFSALLCYFNPEQEAYQGPETSCDVTGLPSNSQLVFCVKVTTSAGCVVASYVCRV